MRFLGRFQFNRIGVNWNGEDEELSLTLLSIECSLCCELLKWVTWSLTMKNCPKLDSYSNAHLSDTFLLDHRYCEEYLKPHLSGIGHKAGCASGDDIDLTEPLMKMKNKFLPYRNGLFRLNCYFLIANSIYLFHIIIVIITFNLKFHIYRAGSHLSLRFQEINSIDCIIYQASPPNAC